MKTITYLTPVFTNPFLAPLKRRRRSENIIAISNPFFPLGDLTLHFSIHVTVNWYNATMFKLK